MITVQFLKNEVEKVENELGPLSKQRFYIFSSYAKNLPSGKACETTYIEFTDEGTAKAINCFEIVKSRSDLNFCALGIEYNTVRNIGARDLFTHRAEDKTIAI